MSQFLIGNFLRLRATVTSEDTGALIDVDELVLTIRPADAGVEAVYTLSLGEITHDSQGKYHCDHLPEKTGKYSFRWASSGSIVTAAEDSFTMLKSRVL